ncbi:cleavage and polyadenylation specificity factor subunit 4-like [Artemia franciscana]|uniref:Cleavage and polyadenylation specificity factor subunit 4 n=1 Tax=Artemia franciscana TaxID=6661 RepID=A0AA88L2W5_ARTSF|nr:hypothetical protein QYM36_008897 [Artemia franciscana]
MEALIAPVSHLRFDIESALEQQTGAQPLPFAGMDKSTAGVCVFYSIGSCDKSQYCPFRHVRGDRTVVCKHWLRGLCKKGDQCEFLHEYDMTKMPECYFFARFNACHNKECPFLHIDPESKIRDCPWYDRGFCRHGAACRHRHVRRVLCMDYVAGFCANGSGCKFVHPRFELPQLDKNVEGVAKPRLVCHHCGELGHKITHCFKLAPEIRVQMQYSEHARFTPSGAPPATESQTPSNPAFPKERGPLRPLEEVTCYKCHAKGHYANRCTKGNLAFLSNPMVGIRQDVQENVQS